MGLDGINNESEMKSKRSHTTTIWVRAGARRYPVWLGRGLLRQSGRRLARLRPQATHVFVISSPCVWRLWGRELARGLRAGGLHTEAVLFDDRETNKRLATVERLAASLVARGADRGALLVALGGGVVGDVTGFLAATYMRGVEYVQAPTTLVGQLDSAIGGKTGVNLHQGKNLLGAFHHPAAVLADTRTLSTLPPREFRAGLYEAVKYGIIGDAPLFRFFEWQLEHILRRERHALRTVLERSIRQKARIVARDERERGLRRILNFGHTIGHALETLGGYRRLRHGEAVGWGMLAATRLALRLGRLPASTGTRIEQLIRSLGSLPPWPRVPPRRIYEQLFADKKKRGGELHLVLPRGIGRVDVVRGIQRTAVLGVLRDLQQTAR